MQEFYTLQSQYCSDVDIKKICSFDYELIEEPTDFIYHQSPRFILIKKGCGKFMVDTELYEIKKDTCFQFCRGIAPKLLKFTSRFNTR